MQAFDESLDLVVSLGWAYADRFCLENMLQAVGSAPQALQPSLTALAQLYGASKVETNLAFFLAQGVMGKAEAEASRAAVNGLCRLLSADDGRVALQLCDGFGIPDHLIAAPIAGNWRQM